MGHVQIDVPHNRARLVDDHDLVAPLYDQIRPAVLKEIRHPGRQAGRTRVELLLAFIDLLDLLLHHVLGPWHQIRMGEVGDMPRACRDEWTAWVLPRGNSRCRHGREYDAERMLPK